jgi:hypothetical protein
MFELIIDLSAPLVQKINKYATSGSGGYQKVFMKLTQNISPQNKITLDPGLVRAIKKYALMGGGDGGFQRTLSELDKKIVAVSDKLK